LNKRFILFSVTATNLFVAAPPGRSLLRREDSFPLSNDHH